MASRRGRSGNLLPLWHRRHQRPHRGRVLEERRTDGREQSHSGPIRILLEGVLQTRDRLQHRVAHDVLSPFFDRIRQLPAHSDDDLLRNVTLKGVDTLESDSPRRARRPGPDHRDVVLQAPELKRRRDQRLGDDRASYQGRQSARNEHQSGAVGRGAVHRRQIVAELSAQGNHRDLERELDYS